MKRFISGFGILIVLILSCITIYFLSLGATFDGFRISSDGIRLSRNLDQVGPDAQLLRSAQLTGEELKKFIEDNGIKTVINLQGARPSYAWYDDELRVSKELHVDHYDFGLSTETIPRAKDLREILTLLHTAPKPILIHCRSGSDRTGLISAIYAYDFLKQPKSQAIEQISGKFWHTPLLTPAQSYFFLDIYQGEDWAMKTYTECDPKLKYADRSACSAPP